MGRDAALRWETVRAMRYDRFEPDSRHDKPLGTTIAIRPQKNHTAHPRKAESGFYPQITLSNEIEIESAVL